MPPVPEYLLRKLFVKDSLNIAQDGFSFQLFNSISQATILWFSLDVDGKTVAPHNLLLKPAGGEAFAGSEIDTEKPLSLPVGKRITVQVKEVDYGGGDLRFNIHTREVGSLSFSIKPHQLSSQPPKAAPFRMQSRFKKPLKTDVTIRFEDVIGEIDPNIYGQFVEHLERCVYDGLWTADGSELRHDTLELVKQLHPPLIRYPGGNFASGYHWEDGIGPRAARPARFDEAWKAQESNQVGTDEFMEVCRQTGAAPFLVVNCGSGTPEEAARWVAYCNEPATSVQGQRRASNGHSQPYQVKLWGVGNEVWGPWQIGHTDADTYTQKLRDFANAMRQIDAGIQLVAVGQAVLSDEVDDPGRLWNETVLRGAGDVFDFLSVHLYQPDPAGWQEEYDAEALFKTVCAAPLDAERMLERVSTQIKTLQPDRNIGIAFDEWNLWLPPADDAGSMHQVVYRMRDALYTAGMLNVFHRQCRVLKIANLAQLVNVLPLIVTTDDGAFATPLYYPFLLYKEMKNVALRSVVRGKYYDSEALGNIAAVKDVPYIDISATRDNNGDKVIVSIINRHPTSRSFVDIELKGFPKMKLSEGWLMHNPDALAANTPDTPGNVKSKQVGMPEKRGARFKLDLPPLSISILALNRI